MVFFFVGFADETFATGDAVNRAEVFEGERDENYTVGSGDAERRSIADVTERLLADA